MSSRLSLPLSGHTIGLTRDIDDEGEMVALERAGARLVSVPLTIKVRGPDFTDLVGHLKAGASFDELIFTSRNGVLAMREALTEAQRDIRVFASVRTWAVGPQTAQAMWELLTLRADAIPTHATAEGLVELLQTHPDLHGKRVLFPASAQARRVLPSGLKALGAHLTELSVYDTIANPESAPSLISAIRRGLSLLTVASPSAVRSLAKALEDAGLSPSAIPVAAIGPVSADAAQAHGMTVAVVPKVYNLKALAEAIVEAAQAGRLVPTEGSPLV